jgi:hypothetical protein
MIQVGLLLGDDSHSQTLRRFLPAVAKRGVEFVEWDYRVLSTRPDVWIIHQEQLKEGHYDPSLDPPGKYCLLDNKDGADLCSVARKTLCSEFPPSSIWKKSVYADPNLYNDFHGRYHEWLIARSLSLEFDPEMPSPHKLPVQIPPDRLHRIKCPFAFHAAHEHPQKILKLSEPEAAYNTDRPIHACFAGWMDYKIPLLAQHRELCVEALTRLSSKFRIEVHRGRPFGLDEYANMLFQSKVVVSPYGLGEEAFRDYEAIFAGCVVIKPDSRHVESLRAFPTCRPDFADLEEAIQRGLELFNDHAPVQPIDGPLGAAMMTDGLGPYAVRPPERHFDDWAMPWRLLNRQTLIDSLDPECVADALYSDIVRASVAK